MNKELSNILLVMVFFVSMAMFIYIQTKHQNIIDELNIKHTEELARVAQAFDYYGQTKAYTDIFSRKKVTWQLSDIIYEDENCIWRSGPQYAD